MDTRNDVAALAGRLLLALMFLVAGYGKITGYDDAAGYMVSAGLPMVGVLLPLTILLELGGGFALIVGWKTRWFALALAAFTVLATLLFHNFWAMTGDAVMANTLFFYKNVAVIGGLLTVFAFGPGRFSVDSRVARDSSPAIPAYANRAR
jgi:putative oxidoreductase